MHTTKAEIIRTENCSEQIYDQHCHTDFEILFVLAGSIRLNLEGEQLTLQENTGIVIEPLKYHIVTGNNSRYHRLVLTFSPESVPEAVYDRFLSSVQTNAMFEAESISRLLIKFGTVLEQDDQTFAPLLQAMLTEALYSLAFENTTPVAENDNKRSHRLKQIISFVDRNLHREITLEDIAAQLYMSQSALCHMFREEMNISLKQYILQKKMMYAKSLLQKGTAPGIAATLCGYKNYASFYKIFQKVTGQTPGQIQAEE